MTVKPKNKIKVGYFFRNGSFQSVDFSRPTLGNPGVGGRAYMNLLMATELSKDASFDVYFYVERATKLPDELRVVACGSLDAALKMAGDAELDFFVTDVTVQYQRMKHLVKQYESNNLNVIVRLGLIPSSKILNLLSESTSIKSVIAVEQTVFDILRDHPVSKKMHVVQNSIPLQMYKQHYPKDISSDCVEITYLGSLVPQKGFGLLAKIWKQILEQHPFAVLNVIGTGQVYGLGDKMGKWGIAEETFESELRKHLMDSDGNPHRSVIFHGILGSNKAKVIENSTVGIANPSGATETFCLSAVELQAGGLPVIAGARYGLNDTVIDGQTGFLVKGEERLKKKLLYLLSNPDVAFNMKRAAKNYVFHRYDSSKVIEIWKKHFVALSENNLNRADLKPGRSPEWLPKLARINCRLKSLFGAPDWWPSVIRCVEVIAQVRRSVSKLGPVN